MIVYGGTSAGVIAAVQAAHLGKATVLIEPGQHLGGTTASGLGATDVGNADTIGGLALTFYGYIYQYYHESVKTRPVASSDRLVTARSRSLADSSWVQFNFEPHVAESVLTAMLAESGAALVLGERLERKTGVAVSMQRIVSVTMESGRTFAGRVFIDATYEGDLMAAAGVSYRIGRESSGEFGETLAGVHRNANLRGEADPYRVAGQPASGLLPGISSTAPGGDGTGDSRVQQYNFRLCMTNKEGNRVALAQPDGYDATHYQLLARRIEAHPDWILGSDICKMATLPRDKVDVNATGSFSTDMAGDESSQWAEASYAERDAIWNVHRNYIQGMFWFLANDASVPAAIRTQMAGWGLAKDEFTDTGHWPWQLYVREARRMAGAYLMTQHDCEGTTRVADPIALGSYGLDSHKVTLFVDDSGLLNTEGFFFKSVDPYPIGYRAITPKAAECTNLLVPVCVSATHVAFNSLRMEPVYMMLGQAAATAACLAIDRDTTVQDLDYATLARKLEADGQILTWDSADQAADAAVDTGGGS